jgi:hypothetical protein
MQCEWFDTGDGQVIQYIEWKHWDLPPPGTPSRDPNELIVNLNPGYLGVLSNTGSELQLSLAMISAVTVDVLHALSDLAIPASRLAYAISLMSVQAESILADPRVNGNTTLFQFLWATSTNPPWNSTGDWDLLLPAQQAESSFHLSILSASLLWDKTLLGSIANSSPDSVLELHRASSSPDSISKWAGAFAMDSAAASTLLLRWLPRYMCGKSDPLLCAATGSSGDCGCSQDPNPECGYVAREWRLPCNAGIGALTWQQYVQGTISVFVWNQPSMITAFPSIFPGSIKQAPELAIYLQQDLDRKYFVPTEAAVVWLTGPCGIANASNILEWLKSSLLDPAFLLLCYNMTQGTAAPLNFYLLSLHSFAQEPYAQSVFSQNGGIMRQQSAFDWLFNTIDPLVHRLSPSQANINFFHNLTWEKTRSAALFDTMYTGKGAKPRPPVSLSLHRA